MYIETWAKCWCQQCDMVNWVCLGDLSDLTVPDESGFICHKCNFGNWFDDESKDEEVDKYIGKGKEEPK